jgi:hypothetical protein
MPWKFKGKMKMWLPAFETQKTAADDWWVEAKQQR